MATSKKSPKKTAEYWPSGQKKLTFYDLMLDKEAKKEVEERLAKGQFTINHLAEIMGEYDKLSIKRDGNGGGWSIFLTFTPVGEYEPVGVYSFRAKHLANAIAGLIWRSEDFDGRHFIDEEDDDF